MDWNDIKLVLCLIRKGSVRSAADSLGVSHSTVARRADALEAQLGVSLFERSSTGYVLTPAGEQLIKTAEKVEDEMTSLERRIIGQDRLLAGIIRLTMVDVLASHLLMPDLTLFSNRYPNIQLEVVIDYEPLNLSRREADIALRFVKDPPEHLMGRKITTTNNAPYASHDYLLHHDLSSSESANWIGFGGSSPYPKWVKQSHYPHLPAKGIFNSMLLQLEATRAGMGIGYLPCFLGDADPDLQRLAPSTVSPGYDLWLLRHPDTRSTTRLQVFSEFITKAIQQQIPLIKGLQQ